MSKIESMTVEEMRDLLSKVPKAQLRKNFRLELRLILAWIHAEARAREAEWGHGPGCPSREALIKVVKAEVGWPEDE